MEEVEAGVGQQASQEPGGPPSAKMGKTRSVSETRQKGRIRHFRVTVEEEQFIKDAAERVGLTVGSYLRSRALDTPTTRAIRRPTVEVKILSALLASLNKTGNNLNQLARAVNLGNSPLIHDIHAALGEHRQILAVIIQTLGRGAR